MREITKPSNSYWDWWLLNSNLLGVPASRAAADDDELPLWEWFLRRGLTSGIQRNGVSGRVAVDGRCNDFDAQSGVYTQEKGDDSSNVWGGH
jgi:hypothetical protein